MFRWGLDGGGPGAFIPGAVTRTGLERANPVHRADGQPSRCRMRHLAIDLTKGTLTTRPTLPSDRPAGWWPS
jgi:hypothetical protein